jgi:predicted AAA+ superfamily ATPase
MKIKFQRLLKLDASAQTSCFLWGPRQTGKSTLLKDLFPEAKYYDLLLSEVYSRLLSSPSLIRQECEALGLTGETQTLPIIIDEVQKLPLLLDEVHWLIENRALRFILCGSSPRKLKQSGGHLLGGRAVRYQLFPFVFPEIQDFSLLRALNHGLIPRHYLAQEPAPLLEAYVGDYLKEEIIAEAATRKIPAFSRFLEVAALSNGEIVNFQNIASECGVTAPTVKSYFQILDDTLLGAWIPAFRKQMKRRVILSPKFYFFDVGVVAHLTRRGVVRENSELFGKAFEHLLVLEVLAHSKYSGLNYPVQYWRTASQFEVDLILGQGETAVEIKATPLAQDYHLKGLRAFREEHKAKCLLVSQDPHPRKTADGILILPWRDFLSRLWAGDLMNGHDF